MIRDAKTLHWMTRMMLVFCFAVFCTSIFCLGVLADDEATYYIEFDPGDGDGFMETQEVVVAEDVILNDCQFTFLWNVFDHWEDENGNCYSDGATIPANTFEANDVLMLTAVYTEKPRRVYIENGEFTVNLRPGESVQIDDLPAGAAYWVIEENTDNWVQVESNNISGNIESLQTATATFVNQYQPDVTAVQIIGMKYMDNKPAAENSFEFSLIYDGEEIMYTDCYEGGLIKFDPLYFTEEDVGEYTYQIQESNVFFDWTLNDDIVYDTHVETVTVSVYLTDDGKVKASVEYDEDGIVFNNYSKPGILNLTKMGWGYTDASKDSIFTFEIELFNQNGIPLNDGSVYWFTKREN